LTLELKIYVPSLPHWNKSVDLGVKNLCTESTTLK